MFGSYGITDGINGITSGCPMRLIGIDPGLANFGICSVELGPDSEHVDRLRVVRTEKATKKRNIRTASDLSDRISLIAGVLESFIGADVVAFCVEERAIPYRGGRMLVKPSAVAALGRVRGLVDAYAAMYRIPIIEESPQALKKLLTGSRSASKAEVAQAIERRYPETKKLWPAQKTLLEHAADSVAAVVAGLESDVVRAVRRARTPRLEAIP